jgi:hypothetical protein
VFQALELIPCFGIWWFLCLVFFYLIYLNAYYLPGMAYEVRNGLFLEPLPARVWILGFVMGAFAQSRQLLSTFDCSLLGDSFQ